MEHRKPSETVRRATRESAQDETVHAHGNISINNRPGARSRIDFALFQPAPLYFSASANKPTSRM